MVGRLVQQQRVGGAQQHARHRQPRALAAGEHAGLLVDVVAAEQEAAEDLVRIAGTIWIGEPSASVS